MEAPKPSPTPKKTTPKKPAPKKRKKGLFGFGFKREKPERPVLERLVHHPGEVINGKFILEKKIGEGGYSTVFRAKKIGTDEYRALKFIAPNPEKIKDEESLKGVNDLLTFQAQTEERLRDHPNSVTYYGSEWLPNNTLCLEYELLEGFTVDNFIEYHKARGLLLPNKVAACIALQSANALRYAHKNKIYHLDLTPENFHVGLDGRVKLFDWENLEGILGKPGFASPTAVKKELKMYSDPTTKQKEDPGKRDSFSLGIVLWNMITGDNPLDKREEYTEIIDFVEHEKQEEKPKKGSWLNAFRWLNPFRREKPKTEEQIKKEKEKEKEEYEKKLREMFWHRLDESRSEDLSSLHHVCGDVSTELSDLVDRSIYPNPGNRDSTENIYFDLLDITGCNITYEEAERRLQKIAPDSAEQQKVEKVYKDLVECLEVESFEEVQKKIRDRSIDPSKKAKAQALYEEFLDCLGYDPIEEARRITGSYLRLVTEDIDFNSPIIEELQLGRDLIAIAEDNRKRKNQGVPKKRYLNWDAARTFVDAYGDHQVKNALIDFIEVAYQERFIPLTRSIEDLEGVKDHIQGTIKEMSEEERPDRIAISKLHQNAKEYEGRIESLKKERKDIYDELEEEKKEIASKSYDELRAEFKGELVEDCYLAVYDYLMKKVNQFNPNIENLRRNRGYAHEMRTTGTFTMVEGGNLRDKFGLTQIVKAKKGPNGQNGGNGFH